MQRRRKPKKLPSRAARYARSPQPPNGVILFYRMAMRALVKRWAQKIQARLLAAAERITQDAASDDGSALSEIGIELVRAAAFGDTLTKASERAVKHNQREFTRIGIKIRDAEPNLAPKIKQWRRENVRLVTRLFKRESKTLEKLLTEGEGRSYKSLAGDIMERLDVTARKAELIARDQTLKLNAQINQERQQAAGITEFAWSTSNDERVRESHQELDGKRFRYDDPPIVDGEPTLPGEAIQCRCVAYPILPELED
jgi:SPP1 gp7 family putative phage head morphogenesis protein